MVRVLLVLLLLGAPPAAARPPAWLDAWTRLQPPPRPLLDEDAPLEARVRAAERLGRYGDADLAVSTLIAALEQALEPALREAVLEALTRRGAGDAVPALRALLEDEATRQPQVIHALAAIGGEDAAAGLVYALRYEALRETARSMVTRLGRDAVAALIPALEGSQARVAADLLGVLGHPAAVPALIAQARRDRNVALRVASLDALGRIGDARARPVALRALKAVEPAVVAAASRALARCGTSEDASALARLTDAPAASTRAAALRALARLAPERARGPLRNALESGDAALRGAALEMLLDHTHASWLEELVWLVEEEIRPAHAASALARLDTAEGVRALDTLASKKPNAIPSLRRAIALGLRRHGAALGSQLRERSMARLRAEPSLRRRLRLRSVARDAEALPWLVAFASSPATPLRAEAALGLQLLNEAEAGAVLRMRLRRERSAQAFRSQARAALALGICVPPGLLLTPRRQRAETAPEALELAASCAHHGSESERLRLAERLRDALRWREGRRNEPARVRAAAARGLGLSDDPLAATALRHALDDPDPAVRRAVWLALGRIARVDALPKLRAWARVERNPAVHRVAEHVLEPLARGGRFIPPSDGPHALELRLRRADPDVPVPEADILLPDGRWMRMQPLDSGELLLPDLPEGPVDVRLHR